MSLAAVFDKLGTRVMPHVIDAVSNGECRILEHNPDLQDDQGFPSPAYVARTFNFIPCVWKIRTNQGSSDDEQDVARQTRGVLKYKITVGRVYDDEAVVIKTADRIELRQRIGVEELLTLEIVGPVNVSNVVWEVMAVDTDAP